MIELTLQLALDRFLADKPFYPCCLLVDPDVRRLEQTGEEIAAAHAWPRLSLGAVVAESLLSVPVERRPGRAGDAVTAAIRQAAPGPLVCVDVDLLFEPSLALDPLRL